MFGAAILLKELQHGSVWDWTFPKTNICLIRGQISANHTQEAKMGKLWNLTFIWDRAQQCVSTPFSQKSCVCLFKYWKFGVSKEQMTEWVAQVCGLIFVWCKIRLSEDRESLKRGLKLPHKCLNLDLRWANFNLTPIKIKQWIYSLRNSETQTIMKRQTPMPNHQGCYKGGTKH